MIQERTDEFKFTFIFYDILAALAAYALAFYIRFFIMDPTLVEFQRIDMESYLFFGVLLIIIQGATFFIVGVYEPARFSSLLDELGPIILGIVLNLLLSFSVLFFFQISQIARILPVLYTLIALVLTVLGHSLLRRFIRWRLTHSAKMHKVVILGSGRTAARLARLFNEDKILGFEVVGFIRETEDREGLEPDLGHIHQLEEIIDQYRPHTLVFATGTGGHKELPWILSVCDKHGVHLKIVPGYEDLITIHGKVENLNGFSIISIRDIPARLGVNRLVKRGFDIIFSLIFIIVFSPIFLLAALIIKLTSKGPVFFVQERIGLDGRPFPIIKFRTMYIQDKQKSDVVWTTKNDPRVTPIGRILRKSSVDEFPQFFNVLAGHMSVVGPRPERPYYVEKFKELYPSFKRRHAVKAGITGWAQVNGFRGDTSIQERIEADIYYIENWSLWLDIKIILMTPFKGMFNRNAY
jgi:exopolysaccharide biosynthesis polyprenyl glycosylphosphotransferase